MPSFARWLTSKTGELPEMLVPSKSNAAMRTGSSGLASTSSPAHTRSSSGVSRRRAAKPSAPMRMTPSGSAFGA